MGGRGEAGMHACMHMHLTRRQAAIISQSNRIKSPLLYIPSTHNNAYTHRVPPNDDVLRLRVELHVHAAAVLARQGVEEDDEGGRVPHLFACVCHVMS